MYACICVYLCVLLPRSLWHLGVNTTISPGLCMCSSGYYLPMYVRQGAAVAGARLHPPPRARSAEAATARTVRQLLDSQLPSFFACFIALLTPSESTDHSGARPPTRPNPHTDADLSPTDTLEAALRLSRTEAALSSPFAPLDRLLLPPQDMRRLGLRAGDWVEVIAAAAAAAAPDDDDDEENSPSTPGKGPTSAAAAVAREGGGVAVMRAWPAAGVALPAGTVGWGRVGMGGLYVCLSVCLFG
jgi:hypothetical protein